MHSHFTSNIHRLVSVFLGIGYIWGLDISPMFKQLQDFCSHLILSILSLQNFELEGKANCKTHKCWN